MNLNLKLSEAMTSYWPLCSDFWGHKWNIRCYWDYRGSQGHWGHRGGGDWGTSGASVGVCAASEASIRGGRRKALQVVAKGFTKQNPWPQFYFYIHWYIPSVIWLDDAGFYIRICFGKNLQWCFCYCKICGRLLFFAILHHCHMYLIESPPNSFIVFEYNYIDTNVPRNA